MCAALARPYCVLTLLGFPGARPRTPRRHRPGAGLTMSVGADHPDEILGIEIPDGDGREARRC